MGTNDVKLHVNRVISAGLTGTTFMTLFSYLVSATKDENFREPELLGKLLNRLIPELDKNFAHIAGWNIHYAAGFIFAFFYSNLWKEKIPPGIKSGFILGGLSGLFAIMVWKTVFKLHPAPPQIRFRKYYGHLFVTHLVFGVFASIGYKVISRLQIIT